MFSKNKTKISLALEVAVQEELTLNNLDKEEPRVEPISNAKVFMARIVGIV